MELDFRSLLRILRSQPNDSTHSTFDVDNVTNTNSHDLYIPLFLIIGRFSIGLY